MAQHVIVIGGGVIGLCSAYWLLDAGYRVSLVERALDVGRGASERNGGQLSYRYVAPLADAGVPLKALQWLLQRDAPLRWRPQADKRQWHWLLQFLRRCNSADCDRTTAMLLRLGALSRAAMAQLALQLPLSEFGWRNPGKLVFYRSARQWQRAVAKLDRDDDSSVALTPAAAVALEPALSSMQARLAGAIYDSGAAVADCHAFCLALARQLQAHPHFHGIVHAEVHGWRTAHGKIAAITTGAGALAADHYVLAAGIASRDLAADLGLLLPLYPLKGYSLSAPIHPQHCAPDISVTDFERKTLYARIGDQLRVAAMVDLVGTSTAIDPRRIASLQRLARSAMPDGADYDHAIAWAGLRPATPGGAPIVGATQYPNLWLNVGHGALGFTFACGTASLLADLIRGKTAPWGLDGLSWRG